MLATVFEPKLESVASNYLLLNGPVREINGLQVSGFDSHSCRRHARIHDLAWPRLQAPWPQQNQTATSIRGPMRNSGSSKTPSLETLAVLTDDFVDSFGRRLTVASLYKPKSIL